MCKNLISDIIAIEWDMFSHVSNVGGPASCQSDPDTFAVMRRSQAETWPEALLACHLKDLRAARAEGRNLMAEKYAWMMEFSFPEEFRAVAEALPPVEAATLVLIQEIVAVNLEWKTETAETFPLLHRRGRPIFTRDDTPWGTSFETYLRGELKTYSPQAVALLHAHTMDLRRRRVNGVAQNLLHQVRHYGFDSLEEAEARQSRIL